MLKKTKCPLGHKACMSNIGFKHVFLCINICWTLRVVLKPEPERGLADASVSENHQKTMFGHYYFIKSFCLLKTLEKKNASKSSFLYYYNGAQKHEGFVGFEKACSRANTYVILMSLNCVHFYARNC